ncbi:MAG TPA: hypothetical protein VGR59_11490, partial [Gemmatimonadaceae bacterium]|nr:hypothetical protein [Gemmatimonadaceae bacterium]
GHTLVLLGLLVGIATVMGACQENLAGGAACPSLCPDTLTVKDIILSGTQAFDTMTNVVGVPPLGTEQQLLIANYVQGGDSVQTAAILRFDSLIRILPDTDTLAAPKPITRVDSSGVKFTVIAPTDTTRDTILVPDSVTFQVFDVDVNAADLDTAPVHAQLNNPPLATRTVPRDSVIGAHSILLDTGWVAEHVREGKRIRLGIRIQTKKSTQLRIGSSDGGLPASLFYFGFSDTTKAFTQRNVNTHTAGAPPFSSLADYDLVLKGTPPPAPGILAAGGIPGYRIYMRFSVPSALIDSSTRIVRANLIIQQLANVDFGTADTADTILLQPAVVQASPGVTNIAAAALLASVPSALGITGVPTVNFHPDVSRPDTIPLVGVFTLWRTQGPLRSQRAIVLESSGEGVEPRQYLFYSNAAADSTLRPRIEISFVPKSGFGLP